MKKVLLLILLIITQTSYSQEIRKNSFGITIGAGKGNVQKQILLGEASFDIYRSINVGINYYGQLNKVLKLELSAYWYHAQLNDKPNSIYYFGVNDDNIQLIYLPLYLRVGFLKHFYINGGPFLDIDLKPERYKDLHINIVTNNQTGFGAGLGLGTEFLISNQFMMQVNPYFNLHRVILTSKDYFPERMIDYGIKIGIRTSGMSIHH